MSALPPLFVVSLPGSSRREAIRQQLSRWPGEWSFVDAVDGAAISPAELEAVYDESSAVRAQGFPLSPPEIGCALSHLKVYEIIVRSMFESAVVLEDDSVLLSPFFSFPFGTFDKDFDVVSFFTTSALVRRYPRAIIADVALHRAAGKVRSTVGYLVSRSGASKLLAASAKIRSVADWPLDPARLAFYVTNPPLVGHAARDSHLGAARLAVRRRWRRRRGVHGWLTEGFAAGLTIPLFIKYALLRECYEGLPDYFRREIREHALRMVPLLYSSLDSDSDRLPPP